VFEKHLMLPLPSSLRVFLRTFFFIFTSLTGTLALRVRLHATLSEARASRESTSMSKASKPLLCTSLYLRRGRPLGLFPQQVLHIGDL